MPVQKTCVVCGKPFRVPPCRALKASTCSNKCAVTIRAKSRERKVTCTCPACGNSFTSPKFQADRRVYCSLECKHRSIIATEKMRNLVLMDKNPMWTGGRTMHTDGYVYIRVPSHPFASNGYVLEHRLVVEEMIREERGDCVFAEKIGENFYLARGCSVHHLNGRREDNSRGNLIVCSPSTHHKIHEGRAIEESEYWPGTDSNRKILTKKD